MNVIFYAWVLLEAMPKPGFRVEQCKVNAQHCEFKVLQEFKTLDECQEKEYETEKFALVCSRKSFD